MIPLMKSFGTALESIEKQLADGEHTQQEDPLL